MHIFITDVSSRPAARGLRHRIAFCTLLVAGFAASPVSASPVQPIQVPMSAENFEIPAPKAGSPTGGPQFVQFLGRRAVYLPSGLIGVKGSKLRDGTIDVDVASKPGGLFAGIAFRVESDANLEIVYLRPLATDTIEAMQYTPRLNGDAIWQLLNSSHEKARAHFPKDQWFHVRLVVSGRSCNVFVNHSQGPTMGTSPRRLPPIRFSRSDTATKSWCI